MQNRGKTFTKGDIKKLLESYKQNSGYIRSWVGDTQGANDIEKLLEGKDLKSIPDDQPFSDAQAELFRKPLETRFQRLNSHWVKGDYRSQENKNTNILYRGIAKYLSEYFQDQRILGLVQFYQNDYIKGKVQLFKCPEEIFITSQNYALPVSEVLEYLKARSFCYKIYDSTGDNQGICSFSERDYENLRAIPAAKEILDKQNNISSKRP